MKTPLHYVRITVAVLALAAGPAFVRAADKSAPEEPNYKKRSAALAVEFLAGAATSDDDLAAFVKSEEIAGADFLAAFKQAVALGREIVKRGTPAQNKNFAGLLADSMGTEASAVAAAGSGSRTPAPTPPPNENEVRRALLKQGLDSFLAHSKTQQIYLARTFDVRKEKEGDWKKFADAIDTIATAARSNTDTPADVEKVRAANPQAGDFLIRFGASGKKRADAAKEKSAAAAGDATAVASTDATAAKATTANVIAKAGGDKPTEQPVNGDAKWRSAGFSLSQGFGVVKGDGDASVGTLIVRWNACQRSTTLKWNDLVNYGSRKGGDYEQVEYFGSRGSALLEKVVTSEATADKVNSTLDLNILWPTTFGPFFGGGAVGERVKFGKDDQGNPKLERPYLVGLSLGWGFYDQASSAFYVDLGYSASPTSGFKHSRPFFGISFDGIVLGKIVGFVRKPVAAPAADQ